MTPSELFMAEAKDLVGKTPLDMLHIPSDFTGTITIEDETRENKLVYTFLKDKIDCLVVS